MPSLPHGDLSPLRIDVSAGVDVHAPWPSLERDSQQLPRSDYQPVSLQFEPEDGDWWREYIEGGYIVWIGAAHPQLDAAGGS